MLTLFTTAKPFAGHTGVIQRNALRSWTRLHPSCDVLLFGDEEGAEEAAADLGIRFVPEVARDDFGMPLVAALFSRAQELAVHDLLCYANADILLMSDLTEAAVRVAGLRSRFLVVGRRWTLDVGKPLDFSSGWEDDLRARVRTSGVQDPPSAIDYFLFSRGWLEQIPALVVGRPGWDNWMLYAARARGVPLVDATPVVMAVHQNHESAWDYEQPGSRANLSRMSEDTRWYDFTTLDATWVLTRSGMVPALQFERLWSHFRAQLILRRSLRPILSIIKKAAGLVGLRL